MLRRILAVPPSAPVHHVRYWYQQIRNKTANLLTPTIQNVHRLAGFLVAVGAVAPPTAVRLIILSRRVFVAAQRIEHFQRLPQTAGFGIACCRAEPMLRRHIFLPYTDILPGISCFHFLKPAKREGICFLPHEQFSMMEPDAQTFLDYLSDPQRPLPKPQEDNEVIEAIWRILLLPERAGGATYSLYFGDQFGAPLYATGLHPRLSKRFSLTEWELFQSHLRQFIESNREMLTHPRCCIGIWVEAGIVWVDVSVFISDSKVAHAFSKEGNQIAMYALNSGEVIATEGNGAPRNELPASQQRLDRLAVQDVYSI